MIRGIVIAGLCLLLIAAPRVSADVETDRKVDSLFLRASSPEQKYQHLVTPSREELGKMGIEAVPRLIEKIETEDARERHALDDIFKRIGPVAVPALVEALDTVNEDGVKNAARCLGQIGDKSATPALLKLFDADKHSIRSTAVTAVGKCHDSSAVQECVDMLGDTVENVRKCAAVALGRIKHPDANPSLIEALDDPHFSVRMSSVRALSQIGEEACVRLIASYDTLSSLAKSLAFEVWANVEFRDSRKALERETKSEDPLMRAFAIYSLARVDPGKAAKTVRRMLKTETDLFVISRIEAAQVLIETQR